MLKKRRILPSLIIAIKKGLAWPLFYTAAFYLVFNGVLTVLFAKLEKKLNYFRG